MKLNEKSKKNQIYSLPLKRYFTSLLCQPKIKRCFHLLKENVIHQQVLKKLRSGREIRVKYKYKARMMERNLREILSPPACLTLSHKGLTLEKPSPVGWKDIKEERN